MSEEYYGKHCVEEQHLKVIEDLMDANNLLEQKLEEATNHKRGYMCSCQSCLDVVNDLKQKLEKAVGALGNIKKSSYLDHAKDIAKFMIKELGAE